MKVVTAAWCAEGKTVLNAQDGCFEQQTPRGGAAALLTWGLGFARYVLVACRASSEGMAAMLSAENMRRPSSCQCSSCSSSTAPTRRVMAAWGVWRYRSAPGW